MTLLPGGDATVADHTRESGFRGRAGRQERGQQPGGGQQQYAIGTIAPILVLVAERAGLFRGESVRC